MRQGRKAAYRADATGCDQLRELGLIGGKARAVSFRMPQMEDARREAPVLAPRARADRPDHDIGVLEAPSGERGLESIDARSPPGKVAPSPKPSNARAAANPRNPAIHACDVLAIVQIVTAATMPTRNPT